MVVTGLGTINPIGNTVPEFWENLASGRPGVRTITLLDVGDFPVRIAGEIDLPDLEPWGLSRKLVRRYDRYMVLSAAAAAQALEDSGLDVERAPHRYGAIIGTGDGGVTSHDVNTEKIHKSGMRAAAPLYLINAVPNMGSGFVAKLHNLQGPNFALSSACATGNHALGLAARLIQAGMADAILAGGAEAPINHLGLAAFGNIMALSERNDSPQTASRPFDRGRDGFVLSEGAAVLCLEELEHAASRGAQIYAELTGIGFSCDAYDMVAPHPEARGSVAAIADALRDAGIGPQEVDLVNAHATSTQIGDLAECVAMHRVFGDLASTVPVQATKSMIGHTIAGAAAIEAVAALLAIHRGVVHPTINLFEQDPQIDLNVITETREQPVRHVLSNSFGFAGQNAVLVLSSFTR